MILLMVLVLSGQSLYVDTATDPVGDQDIYLHFIEEDGAPRYNAFSYVCNVEDGITYYRTSDPATATSLIEIYSLCKDMVVEFHSPESSVKRGTNISICIKILLTLIPALLVGAGYLAGKRRRSQ